MKYFCKHCGKEVRHLDGVPMWEHEATRMMFCSAGDNEEPESFYAIPIPEGCLWTSDEVPV
jgi:hypothetical protein